MKLKLLFSYFILIGFSAFGQLLNGDFESWSTVEFEDPKEWETSNSEVYERGLGFNATKVSPGFKGTYALRLETKGSTDDKNVGYCINGMGDPLEGKGGIPYSMKPDSFIFNAKLGIVNGDSAIFLVIFKKAGNIIGLNLGKFVGDDPETWKRFAFKLQPLPFAPDTVIIGIASSDAFEEDNIKVGSFIVVDNLKFSTSQTITNGGFEEWTSQTFNDLEHWNSDNYSLALLGRNYIEKTSDAHKGESACKITTLYEPTYDYYFNDIMNGTFGETTWKGGFSYSEMKDTLVGWYKYMPNQTDTAIVNITFKKEGAEIFWSGTILLPSDEYKKFEIPLALPTTPDSAMIQIMSSNWPPRITQNGSVLIIDELQFKSALLNTELAEINPHQGFNIFPNPADNGFYILNKSDLGQAHRFTILDNTGRIVKRGQCLNDKTYVDMTGLSGGLYLVNVWNKNDKTTKKLMLK